MKNQKIGIRLNIYLSVTIIVLLSAFGIYTYNSQMTSYLSEADEIMREEVQDLARFVKQEYNFKNQNGKLSEESQQRIKELFSNKRYYTDGYPYLVDNNGIALIHPTKEGSSFASYDFFNDMIRSNSKIGRSEYLWEGENKIQYFMYVDEVEAFVSVTIYEHYMKAKVRKSINTLVLVILILITVFVVLIWQITRTITSGLNKAVTFAEQIAQGDLTHTLKAERNDEIGKLTLALENMKLKLEEIIAEILEGANQITTASQDLSSSSTEQAASTEEVSSSMEEMIANIEQNTENAIQTEKIANKAAHEIDNGYQSVNHTVQSMQNIAEKITIIEEIAEKTDLLAINAAIEAARAGEHGKGFAVVAMEVRKLAERSQLAASEINKVSKSSVGIAEETGIKMGEIVPEIQKTSALVQEIAASSKEQNSGAEQVNNALQLLNQTNQNTAANAEELASQAEVLKDAIAYFTVNHASQKTRTQKTNANKTVNEKLQKQPNEYQAQKGIILETDYETYS